MGLREDLIKAKTILNSRNICYGFDKPKVAQQWAILAVIKDRDVLYRVKQEQEKLVCFQWVLRVIDMFHREPQVLKLSPTRELAEQTQKVILALGDHWNFGSGEPWISRVFIKVLPCNRDYKEIIQSLPSWCCLGNTEFFFV